MSSFRYFNTILDNCWDNSQYHNEWFEPWSHVNNIPTQDYTDPTIMLFHLLMTNVSVALL